MSLQNPTDDTSPSILVRLLNRLLYRPSTHSILTKLLLPRQLPNKKPPVPTPDLNALLPEPDASLISGFNQFLEESHKRPTTMLPRLTMEAAEFQKLLEAVPKERMEEVLLVRQREYGEYLRELEKHRKEIQTQLKHVDSRIMQAAEERRQIEQMLETEEEAPEDADTGEQDDVPRLKRLQHLFAGHSGMITSLAADRQQGLVASGAVDMRAIVWDLQTGRRKYTLEGGHQDILTGVQFHDRFLLTSSLDSRIRMWDLRLLDSIQPTDPQDLCCETTFVGHQRGVTCFQSHDMTLVSASEDRTVREWDMAAGEARQSIDVSWVMRDGGYVTALQFYQFALATGSTDGVLRLWDLRTSQPHRQLAGPHHGGGIVSLEFDDRSVVTGSDDGAVALWDLRMGRVLQTIRYDGAVSCTRLSQTDGGTGCWVAAKDPWLHHYSHRSMQQIRYASDYGRLNSQPVHGSSVTQIHCIDQGLVTGDDKGGVRIWQI